MKIPFRLTPNWWRDERGQVQLSGRPQALPSQPLAQAGVTQQLAVTSGTTTVLQMPGSLALSVSVQNYSNLWVYVQPGSAQPTPGLCVKAVPPGISSAFPIGGASYVGFYVGPSVNGTTGIIPAGGMSITASASPLPIAAGQDIPLQIIPATVVKPINTAVAAAIWTPAAGKRFRLQGIAASIAAAATVELLDGGAGGTGFAYLELINAAPGTMFTFPAAGYVSLAVNNTLWMTNGGASQIYGYACGDEE